MVLLLFATSIAATGIVHQVGWLFRADQLVEDASRSRLTTAIIYLKQVAAAIRLYADDHNGVLPATLEELLPDYLETNQFFFLALEPNEPPERILYFTGHHASDPADSIILASPVPVDGKRAVTQIDRAVRILDEAAFQAGIGRQTPAAARRVSGRRNP